MIDISIDIETFGAKNGSSIASIGAVADSSGNSAMFYVVLNDPTGGWEPRTVRWHASNPDMLKSVGSEDKAVPLVDGLKDFANWLRNLGADKDGKARLWTHATFDMPQLQAAYDRAGIFRPWHYRNCRDLRTLYDLAGGRPKLERVGHHHNGLDDAKYQMDEIRVCLDRMQRDVGPRPQGLSLIRQAYS